MADRIPKGLKEVQLLGGPHDGQWVPYSGDVYQEFIPPEFKDVYDPNQLIGTEMDLGFRLYKFRMWEDANGHKHPRYVLNSHLKGLGAE